MFNIITILALSGFSFWRGYILFKTIAVIEEAKSWEKTQTTVIDSRVTKTKHRRIDGKLTSNFFFSTFYVNGIKFGCYKPSLHMSNKKTVSRTLQRTKPGDTVNVFYDPKKPENNVFIDPNNHGNFIDICIFVFSFLVLFIFTAFSLIG